MPLQLLAFKTHWVREGSGCPPVCESLLVEEKEGQLLHTVPPAAPWQGPGTGVDSERTSVSVSKSGADLALGELSPNQGSARLLGLAFSIRADHLLSIISHQIKAASVRSFSQFSRRSRPAMAADGHRVPVSSVAGPFHVLWPPPSRPAVAATLSRHLCPGGCWFSQHRPAALAFMLPCQVCSSLALLRPGSPPALDPSRFPLQLTDLIPCRPL